MPGTRALTGVWEDSVPLPSMGDLPPLAASVARTPTLRPTTLRFCCRDTAHTPRDKRVTLSFFPRQSHSPHRELHLPPGTRVPHQEAFREAQEPSLHPFSAEGNIAQRGNYSLQCTWLSQMAAFLSPKQLGGPSTCRTRAMPFGPARRGHTEGRAALRRTARRLQHEPPASLFGHVTPVSMSPRAESGVRTQSLHGGADGMGTQLHWATAAPSPPWSCHTVCGQPQGKGTRGRP